MGDPLDDALRRVDLDQNVSRRWQREEMWHRFIARKKVVDTTTSFLSRMGSAGNPGTERLKLGKLGKQKIWNIHWIIRESRGGFLLTPDGMVTSSGFETDNDLTPYRDAQFFGLNGAEATLIERQGSPDQTSSREWT
jgi:hypothetical protein